MYGFTKPLHNGLHGAWQSSRRFQVLPQPLPERSGPVPAGAIAMPLRWHLATPAQAVDGNAQPGHSACQSTDSNTSVARPEGQPAAHQHNTGNQGTAHVTIAGTLGAPSTADSMDVELLDDIDASLASLAALVDRMPVAPNAVDVSAAPLPQPQAQLLSTVAADKERQARQGPQAKGSKARKTEEQSGGAQSGQQQIQGASETDQGAAGSQTISAAFFIDGIDVLASGSAQEADAASAVGQAAALPPAALMADAAANAPAASAGINAAPTEGARAQRPEQLDAASTMPPQPPAEGHVADSTDASSSTSNAAGNISDDLQAATPAAAASTAAAASPMEANAKVEGTPGIASAVAAATCGPTAAQPLPRTASPFEARHQDPAAVLSELLIAEAANPAASEKSPTQPVNMQSPDSTSPSIARNSYDPAPTPPAVHASPCNPQALTQQPQAQPQLEQQLPVSGSSASLPALLAAAATGAVLAVTLAVVMPQEQLEQGQALQQQVVVSASAAAAAAASSVEYWLGSGASSRAPSLASQVVAPSEQQQVALKKRVGTLEGRLTSAPEDVSAVEALALTYTRMQDYARAGNTLSKLVKLQPGNSEAWRLLGETSLLSQQPQRAVQAYEKAVELVWATEKERASALGDRPSGLNVLRAPPALGLEVYAGLVDACLAAKDPARAVAFAQQLQAAAEAASNAAKPLQGSRTGALPMQSGKAAMTSQSGGPNASAGGTSAPLDLVIADLLLAKAYTAWHGHGVDALLVYNTAVAHGPADYRAHLARGIYLKTLAQQGGLKGPGRYLDPSRYSAGSSYVTSASSEAPVLLLSKAAAEVEGQREVLQAGQLAPAEKQAVVQALGAGL